MPEMLRRRFDTGRVYLTRRRILSVAAVAVTALALIVGVSGQGFASDDPPPSAADLTDTLDPPAETPPGESPPVETPPTETAPDETAPDETVPAETVPDETAPPVPGPATSDAPPVDRPVLRVMPLGDSITYGIGSQTYSSYRIDLQRRLTAAGLRVDFVGSQRTGLAGTDRDNEGHGGWTIGQITARIDGWLATYRPDVVLLHIGTNDMVRSIDVAHAPNRLSALIDRIRAGRPTAQIFVQQITSAKVPAYQSRITTYNAAIPGIVAGKGPRVHLVDQSSVGRLDLRDSVHPNDFGLAKMSYNLYRAMAAVYARAGHAWPAGVNPYRATTAWRCFLHTTWADGVAENTVDCRWWHRRSVAATTVDGKPSTVRVQRWQVQRFVTEAYQELVDGHYVTKTRRVRKWVNA